MFSLLMFVLSLLFISVAFVLFLVTDVYTSYLPISTLTVVFSIFSVLATACFTVGLAGYQANFIQFGLDQLLEAPSVYLGLFVHWAKWAYNVSATAVSILFAVTVCYYRYYKKFVLSITLLLPVILIISLVFLLIISWCKRLWFYVEPGQENPYKTVFKVLNFARKHRSPPRRSAFTYSDNNRPSRIDFAKERFGGPFTNEQVENVKTFLRILTVLLVLGPVHVLQVPASQFFYSIFGFHVGHHLKNPYHDPNCSTEWMILVQSGVLMQITSVIALPIYTWFIFSLLHRRIPKIFTRLGLGIAIFLLGVFSMFVIDLVGHIKLQNETQNETITSKCMFHMNFAKNYYSLNVHWAAFILPNVLLGIGPLLFETTCLEFISAQSPHSMKGLLVGVFFAIKGLFQFLGSIIIIPFSLKHSWGVGHMKEYPSVISCGFIYLLFTCVVGLIGFVLFSVAARKYKYRERDEVNFYQRDIEEIYDRYLTQAAAENESNYYCTDS